MKLEPSPLPVGTPESIAAEGQDPARWGSCYPQGASHPSFGTVMGCPFHRECIFGRKKPVNKGVYIQTADGSSRQVETSCFSYMGSLHAREKSMNETGEVIAVIADEGEEIETRVVLSADPIACNKNGNMALKEEVRIVKIRPFPMPGEEGSAIPPRASETKQFVQKMIEAKKIKDIQERLSLPKPVAAAPAAAKTTPEPKPLEKKEASGAAS